MDSESEGIGAQLGHRLVELVGGVVRSDRLIVAEGRPTSTGVAVVHSALGLDEIGPDISQPDPADEHLGTGSARSVLLDSQAGQPVRRGHPLHEDAGSALVPLALPRPGTPPRSAPEPGSRHTPARRGRRAVGADPCPAACRRCEAARGEHVDGRPGG